MVHPRLLRCRPAQSSTDFWQGLFSETQARVSSPSSLTVFTAVGQTFLQPSFRISSQLLRCSFLRRSFLDCNLFDNLLRRCLFHSFLFHVFLCGVCRRCDLSRLFRHGFSCFLGRSSLSCLVCH